MKYYLLLLMSVVFLLSCKNDSEFSSENLIVQVAVKEDPNASVVIDSDKNTVVIGVNKSVSLSAVTLNFVISSKSKISPASGSVQDFSSPKTYTVTAENGSKRNYTVSVNNYSDEKKIYRASITALFQDGTGVITDNSVTFTLPYGTNVTNLVVDATLSEGATANPAFGTAQNYSSPVQYTITAANGSKKTYTVSMQFSPQETGVRAVWVTNVASSVLFSEANLTAMVDLLASLNFNTICVSVYNKSQTLFPSQTLADVLGTTPSQTVFDGCSWGDVLGKLIEKAHAKNIKVIAWFEYGFASHYNGQDSPIYNKKPGWISKEINDASKGINTTDTVNTEKNSFYWLNAFHPEVQNFLKNMILECVQKYPNLDGIQGDDRLPALPSEGGYDKYTRNLYKQETGKDVPLVYNESSFLTWKVNKLTTFATNLYNAVKGVRSSCLVTWAPSTRGWAKDNYLQDWPQWLANGKADWISPQLYRNESQGITAYSTLIDGDLSAVFNTSELKKKYVPGMLVRSGSYLPTDAFLAKMIQYNRSKGIYSESTWFYEGVPQKQAVYKAFYAGQAIFPF